MNEQARHLYVVAEHFAGKLRPVTVELIGKARELAEVSGEEVHAVLIGENVEALAQDLIAAGADVVHYLTASELKEYSTEGYTYALEQLCREVQPAAILIGATHNGRDLAPRLSARLQCGVVADASCVGGQYFSRYYLSEASAANGDGTTERIFKTGAGSVS